MIKSIKSLLMLLAIIPLKYSWAYEAITITGAKDLAWFKTRGNAIYVFASYGVSTVLIIFGILAFFSYLADKEQGVQKLLGLIGGAILFGIIPSIIALFN